MRSARYLQVLCLLACLPYAWNKGAKIRASKRPGGKQQGGGRTGGGSSGGGGGGMGGYGGFFENAHRNASHEERLLEYLFRDYDPVARAVMDTTKPVVVGIDFVLLRIHGLDERSQVLTTTGLVIAEWMDDRLTWDPVEFGNLSDIIIKADKLWLPELAVMNGADELIPDFERIRVLLSHDGMLHWEPGGIFRTTCDIDITYFPFDVQHCPLLIGAYSYYSSKMNITNKSHEISTHDFRLNGEWHVYGTSAEWDITVLDCCPGKGYPHVIFTLHLRRRNKFYMMNIVLPCVMLSVLIMIGFFLPPDAGEKISLGISVLLAFTVFLLMIADNIPRTSLAIPLMVIYLTATMTLGTISICLTVLVLNVHHRGARTPVPKWIQKLCMVYLARLICVRTRKSRRVREKVYVKKQPRTSTKKKKTVEGNGVIDDMELLSLTINNPNKSTNGPKSLALNNSACTLTSVASEPDVTSGAEETSEEPDYSKDWHELAHVLDRLFFWILLICMTVSALCILLYPQFIDIERTGIHRS